MESKQVGRRIKELRDELGLSQDEFGAKLGMTRSAISKIEKGWSAVTEKNVMLISQRFGVNKKWLLTGKGAMFKEELEADAIIGMLDVADPLDVEIVRAYLRLEGKYRAAFRELFKGIFEQ